jgi:hypothetical protein
MTPKPIRLRINEKVVFEDVPAPTDAAGPGYSVWNDVLYRDNRALGEVLEVDQLGVVKYDIDYVPYAA